MKRALASIAALLLVAVTVAAQQTRGSICLRRVFVDPDRGPAANPCMSGNFSLRLDDGPLRRWSKTEDVRISDLDLSAKHRVRIYCDGKPHQSFTFRFSEYKSPDLCLFINDLYHTAQLWEPSKLCKCK